MNLYTEDIRELIKEESRIIEDFEKHNAPSEIISEKECFIGLRRVRNNLDR